MITATDPINHTVDVKLLSIRGSDNLPMILYNIKVAIDRGGGGWGEHNLPWIGQQVEVVFESGNSLISTRCFVGRRFYTTSHKPPSHPIFTKDSSYQKGHFEMAEGGSYHFKKTDGTVTSFNAAPHSVEGSKTNARATGTAKTSSEALMDKSQEKTALAKQQLDAVASSTSNLTDLTRQQAQLAQYEQEQKAKTQRVAPSNTNAEENNEVIVNFYSITTQIDDIEDAITLASDSFIRTSYTGDEAVFKIKKSIPNQAYFLALKATLQVQPVGIKNSTIRRSESNNAQGNIPNIRIVVI
jgi:hypothetical protein